METITTQAVLSVNKNTEQCKRSITRLLHMDDKEYCTMKFEHGLQYLKVYHKADEPTAEAIARSPLFWAWWKKYWILRDLAYLHDAARLAKLELGYRRLTYAMLHDPAALAKEIHPDTIIPGES